MNEFKTSPSTPEVEPKAFRLFVVDHKENVELLNRLAEARGGIKILGTVDSDEAALEVLNSGVVKGANVWLVKSGDLATAVKEKLGNSVIVVGNSKVNSIPEADIPGPVDAGIFEKIEEFDIDAKAEA